MGGVFNHINGNLYHYAGNNPIKYTDPDGRNPAVAVAQNPSFWTGLGIIFGTILEDIATFGAGLADDPLTIAIGIGIITTAVSYEKAKENEQEVVKSITIAQAKTKQTQPNRLVIQIQDCSKGNSQATLGTSGTQYGDPRTGVTKAQAITALELATADLALTNKSIVKSPEFKAAKAELEAKILASGPQYDPIKKNALQTTFVYKGVKYRIDLDSYVPSGNAPNLNTME